MEGWSERPTDASQVQVQDVITMEFATIMTISIFLFTMFGLGYAALLLLKPKPLIDTILLSFALGLAVVPIAILVIRILHLPLDIRLLIFLAAIGPAVGIITGHKPQGAVTLTRYAMLGMTVIACMLLFAMMLIGANKYPYLEDDDPWSHAVGAHYVALQKTTAQEQGYSHYLEPYPPYYTALMGVLHQANADLQWVLKFFNALIIGMSLIAVYYAFEALSSDTLKAGVGAVIIGALPIYMSHFIWSQTLAIPVFFIALWALAELASTSTITSATSGWKRLHKENMFWLAMLLVWSATIIQPSSAAVFAILFVAYAAAMLLIVRPLPIAQAAAVVGGGILSAITWLGFILLYGWERSGPQIGISKQLVGAGDTSGGLVYSLRDIVFAPSSSKIDQATGIGLLVTILVLIAIIAFLINWRKLFTAKNTTRVVMLVWLVISLVGIQGNALPFKLFPHRFWVFLAIPAAYLAADAIILIAQSVRKEMAKLAIIAALTLFVILTSIGPRLDVQQATWPPGAMWSSGEEVAAYVQLKQIAPAQTSAFALCTNDDRLIGMNMHSAPWNSEQQALKRNIHALTGAEIAAFMDNHKIEYVVLDSHCAEQIGVNQTQALGESLSATGRFQPVIQRPGVIIARLQ
jgi:hypothetical protein